MTTMNLNARISLRLSFAGAAVLACLAASFSTLAQDFSAADVARNRAIAASPRAIEVFPWLARGVTSPGQPTSAAARSIRADRFRNRALASSPRMIEEFPELDRRVEAVRAGAASPLHSGLPGNRGIAASPRAIEEFPALRRLEGGPAGAGAFQIAPLK